MKDLSFDHYCAMVIFQSGWVRGSESFSALKCDQNLSHGVNSKKI
jgi:hypothetical protein